MPEDPAALPEVAGRGRRAAARTWPARYGHAARDVLRAGRRPRRSWPARISPEPARPRGRGGLRRRPRAGALARRRAAAPHPARPARRARAGGARTPRAPSAWRARDGRRARLGRRARERGARRAGARWPGSRGSCPAAPADAAGEPAREAARCEAGAALERGRVSAPLLMGIVNATPDSFSDRAGRRRRSTSSSSGARALAERRRRDRSTWAASPGAPTARRWPVEEESARVVPLVERLAADGLAVSVDTWRAPVGAGGAGRGRGDGQRRERPERPRAWPTPAPSTAPRS